MYIYIDCKCYLLSAKYNHLLKPSENLREGSITYYRIMSAQPSVSYLDDRIYPIVYERKQNYQNCDTGQVSK